MYVLKFDLFFKLLLTNYIYIQTGIYSGKF